MNTRKLVPPLLAALGISGVCTLLLGHRLERREAPVVPTVQYVAVSRPMQAGDVLTPNTLLALRWPATNAVSGAFTEAANLQGRALLYPVEPGEPLTERMVSAPGAGLGLAGRIPPGLRAIALRSDEIVGVAGFLLPGSHVDVLVTYKSGLSLDPRTVTVLQDAEVVAAGHQVEPDPQGKPATVDVVTLLLSPTDAERAVLASTQGTVHFVLRSGADGSHTAGSGILLSQLGGPSGSPNGNPNGSSPQGTLPAEPMPAPVSGPRRELPTPVRHTAPSASPAPVSSHPALVVETISGDKQVSASFPEGGR